MCYTIPMITGAITTALWSRKKTESLKSLNLLLYGAAIFGFIDHLWNGELFYISSNIAKDLLLGTVITLAVFVVWKFQARTATSKL
ncbi:MAG: hypothetical protein NT079_04070 [Candidatus Omnitrophica bacterium]|nr:hypothetical protein [Candidatus Omnitrophota bacterium]